jgi:preprotein translocase subunit YajC
MYRRVLLGGVTAAVIIGAGGTALAFTGSDQPTPGTPTATSTSSAQQPAKDKAAKGKGKLLKRLSHGQLVTRGKGGFVTHDLITGTVTSVSSTSITVQAADKTSEKFVVNKDTKVRVRTKGKGTASSIASVKKGDHVVVAGTGTSTYTAKHVVDVKK